MTVGYLCAIGIALIFMFYMDGGIGVMMLAFLILMPVFSLILTLLVRKKISISLRLPDTTPKHHKEAIIVHLEKGTSLPLPFLRIQLHADAHFLPLNPKADPLPPRPKDDGSFAYRRNYANWKKRRRTQLLPDILPIGLSLGTQRSADYQIPVQTQFCGAASVSIENAYLSDYLAMFRFRFPLNCSGHILITPDIPEQKTNSTLFRTVSTAVADNDEESDATPLSSASATPGYEHRDYIEGDSLKRINWKLSSKRRHLMVRKDEPVSLARLSVVLDFRRDSRELPVEKRLETEEQLIETALGFLRLCAQNGFPCNLSFTDQNNEWQTVAIDSAEQLEIESINLLRGGFREEKETGSVSAVPQNALQDGCAVLLFFTTNTQAETVASLEQISSQVYLVVPEQEADEFASPKNGSLWLVTPSRTLVPASGE